MHYALINSNQQQYPADPNRFGTAEQLEGGAVGYAQAARRLPHRQSVPEAQAECFSDLAHG